MMRRDFVNYYFYASLKYYRAIRPFFRIGYASVSIDAIFSICWYVFLVWLLCVLRFFKFYDIVPHCRFAEGVRVRDFYV